jgi:hypothetical protein
MVHDVSTPWQVLDRIPPIAYLLAFGCIAKREE